MNQLDTELQDMRWKRINSKKVFEHPRLTVLEDEVELPNGRKVPYLRFSSGGKGVTVICIRDDSILLQREYSYPPDEVLYQFPGGKIEFNETVVEAAKRELTEESNLDVTDVKELGWYYTNNRRSDAKMHVVVARGITDSIALREGDAEEKIISEWIPIAQFESMIRSCRIVNFSVLSAWGLLKTQL
jgi:8-oxo-dGTP pyrophosphatase MutT (NUDIX family)